MIERIHKFGIQTHRVVGILVADALVGIAFPRGVERFELRHGAVVLKRQKRSVEQRLGDTRFDRIAQCRAQSLVLVRICGIRVQFIFCRRNVGFHLFDVFVRNLRTCNECSNFFLFGAFPAHERFNVGMVGVEADHFGSSARGSARIDGTSRCIADLQKTEQSRGFPATRKRLVEAADFRKIRSRARPKFEQPRLFLPQIHDAVFAAQIVLDRLDKARMRLRKFVRIVDFLALLRVGIDAEMAALRARNAVSPVQAGVKPLRRIGRGHLVGKQIDHFIVKNACIFVVKCAGFDAPISPAAGNAVKNLARIRFCPKTRGFVHRLQNRVIRDAALEPRCDAGFGDALCRGRDIGFAHVFLCQNIGRHLRPVTRHLNHNGLRS